MHICDHHIKVYYNIEKRKLVEIEIYKRGQKWTNTQGVCLVLAVLSTPWVIVSCL